MGPLGGNHAVLQHQDAVRVPKGGRPLGDDYQGHPGEVPADGGVEGGGGAPDAGDENKPVEGTGGDQENPDNTGDTTTDSGTEAAGESIGATEGI